MRSVAPTSPSGHEIIEQPVVTIPYERTARVTCPAGTGRAGGGAELRLDPEHDSKLSASYPVSSTGSGPPGQWAVTGYRETATSAPSPR